ncbi:phytoene desaturase family protein [Auraticoccus monumenti]|uniref:Pyridine nucleotide-disulfide oxidoreductase domain-containing protein 2 n=1 Tax=Auraticoccus monumenti TaxID=675864 RepID=A0A1G6WSY0_9ACTN|nr:NAD(P)/FAD-dependent oxidoreductase [Auraticoccus monumenti]SDD68921.1 Phytoene dehydrogenase-related protein [Auraticoccus monumenti]
MSSRRASVVGSGPNGLAAAVVLARAGLEVTVWEAAEDVGGAARSRPLLGPGTSVDLGSAVHPFAVASPVLRSFDLERHGLRWLHSPVVMAHPLDDAPAALLHRSLALTAQGLGRDEGAWLRLHEPVVRRWRGVVDAALGGLAVPRDLVAAGVLGAPGALPAAALARLAWRGRAARALFAGSAAHSVLPLSRPGTSAFGLLFGAAAHTDGWPVPAGGASSLTRALVAELVAHGGVVHVGHPVTALAALPPADVVLLDLAPRAAADLLEPGAAERMRHQVRRFRHGVGVHKVDLLLDGPVPWLDPEVGRAATVHLGGDLDEVGRALAAPHQGTVAGRPFVILSQPSVVDASRAPGGQHVVWAYCHVPHASRAAAAELVEAQLERFAPGTGARVLARRVHGPADLQAQNANLVGGDVVGGSMAGTQLLLRPRPSLHPHRTPQPGVFLCSASTPPGGGVHGMSGYHAATEALHHLGAERPGVRPPDPRSPR